MTKPSNFSPAEALETSASSDAKQSRGTRWMLRIVGAGVLLVGWLAVSLQDIGQVAFVVDTIVFLAMAMYALTATGVLRSDAVKEERKLRLRLLVHNMEPEGISIATTPLMEDAELEPAIVASFGVSGYPWGSETIDAMVQQAESEIAAQSGPENEQGPAMDISKVSRRPGQNAFKPKVHQT
ncbi:MAG: hypothetical protein IIA91_04160 [Chloroflexi bacterium]|nr:hypothetical protein [Chloroflexota bacterium]